MFAPINVRFGIWHASGVCFVQQYFTNKPFAVLKSLTQTRLESAIIIPARDELFGCQISSFDTPNLSAYAADSRLIQYIYRFDLLLNCVSLHLFMHVGQLPILCRAAIKKVRIFLVLRNCKVVICMKCQALHWINTLLVYL